MQYQQILSDKLWNEVQDVLTYWGYGHEGLSECRLEAGRENCYLLHVLKDMLDDVLIRLDEIEDALEQLLEQHQIDVCVIAV